MKSYNARVFSSVEQFNDFPIVFRTNVQVHPNTKLTWIEEVDPDADLEERMWYDGVVRCNMVKDK